MWLLSNRYPHQQFGVYFLFAFCELHVHPTLSDLSTSTLQILGELYKSLCNTYFR
jgi:hypothetical protein